MRKGRNKNKRYNRGDEVRVTSTDPPFSKWELGYKAVVVHEFPDGHVLLTPSRRMRKYGINHCELEPWADRRTRKHSTRW